LKLIDSFIHMSRVLHNSAFKSGESTTHTYTHGQEIRKVAYVVFKRYVLKICDKCDKIVVIAFDVPG
jgi:hypothetical protein